MKRGRYPLAVDSFFRFSEEPNRWAERARHLSRQRQLKKAERSPQGDDWLKPHDPPLAAPRDISIEP